MVVLFLFPIFTYAQFWEVGTFFGGSNYNGEFVENVMVVKETHPTIGGVVRLNLSRQFSLKANFYRGKVSGTDQNAEKYFHRSWDRNLHFRSTIFDIGITPEWNILGYKTGSFKYHSSPYLFAGISLFKMNPQAQYNDEWVNLQPIGTEGQNLNKYEYRKYNLLQFAVPFGFGWKFSVGKNINLGIEASARKTFTDYLDDVSSYYVDPKDLRLRGGEIAVKLANRTGEVNPEPIEYGEDKLRGSPDVDDWYYFLGMTITYSFLPIGCISF